MNVISKALAGALVLTTGVAGPANAVTPHFQDHINLVHAVEAIGVDFLLNPVSCAINSNTYGWYHGGLAQLVVCQENGYAGGPEVPWTDEDLDTLRHEAHHVVQDCVDGVMDGSLDSVYEDPIGLAQDVLSQRTIQSIIRGYSDMSDHRKIMELEAFSVALMDDPREQLRDIRNYCM